MLRYFISKRNEKLSNETRDNYIYITSDPSYDDLKKAKW